MTAVITRQKHGHWVSQDAAPTTYEEPLSPPLTKKEKAVHGAVWITVLTVCPTLAVALIVHLVRRFA